MAQEFSASAANKHMTLNEIEAFCRQARSLGAHGDIRVKARPNTWAETIRKLTVEYDPVNNTEGQPVA